MLPVIITIDPPRLTKKRENTIISKVDNREKIFTDSRKIHNAKIYNPMVVVVLCAIYVIYPGVKKRDESMVVAISTGRSADAEYEGVRFIYVYQVGDYTAFITTRPHRSTTHICRSSRKKGIYIVWLKFTAHCNIRCS